MKRRRNNIFLISAPSGAGKSTLIQLLMAEVPSLSFSISHTTRPPRKGETDGVEYYFVGQERFQLMIETNQFLEWAHVHGHYYGTSVEMVHSAEEQGKDLVLDVDIQGHRSVRKVLDSVISIFILPPSYEVLRERLIKRKVDNPEQIQQRIENARTEIQHYREYDYAVINDDLRAAFNNLAGIVRGERSQRAKMEEEIQKILESFHLPMHRIPSDENEKSK